MKHILLADDHRLVLEVLSSGIQKEFPSAQISTVTSGKALFDFLRRGVFPDILVLDLRMPSFLGAPAISNLTKDFPELKILVLSVEDHYTVVRQAMDLGARGYVTKTDDFSELINGIRTVMQGDFFFSKSIIDQLLKLSNIDKWMNEPDDSLLSQREMEVLKLLSKQHKQGEIAEQLFISTHTVKTHRKKLLRKLGVHNTEELVERATRLGII